MAKPRQLLPLLAIPCGWALATLCTTPTAPSPETRPTPTPAVSNTPSEPATPTTTTTPSLTPLSRESFLAALAHPNPTERIGRLMEIGFQAGAQDPAAQFALLEPELWQRGNYDLRGTFFAEWLRTDADGFFAYANQHFETLHAQNRAPIYQLCYLEPRLVVDTLDRFESEDLRAHFIAYATRTLVEIDPELLWARREQMGTRRIIEAADEKRLYPLAVDFWRRSEWLQFFPSEDMQDYLATEARFDLLPHCPNYIRWELFTALAAKHPRPAVDWLVTHPLDETYYYQFTAEHAPFLLTALRHPELPQSAALSSFIEAAMQTTHGADTELNDKLSRGLLRLIETNPQLLEKSSVRQLYANYMGFTENHETLAALYRRLPESHPALALLEAAALQRPDELGQALVARITRQAPTPERVIDALAHPQPDDWPEAFATQARQTLESLPNENLIWQLTPEKLLTAYAIAPEKIEQVLATADPAWLKNSLMHYEFRRNISLETLPALETLTRKLSPDQAAYVLEDARLELLSHARFAEDKTPYLALTKTDEEAAHLQFLIDQ